MLSLLLKVAGYRRSTPKRRSSRSKRWSRSAQTLFASWAVLGQLGGMGLLVGEALEPSAVQADTGITQIPGVNYEPEESFAIGVAATPIANEFFPSP